MLSASPYHLVLTITSLLYNTLDSTSITYYVVPEDHTNSSANTLRHYMHEQF